VNVCTIAIFPSRTALTEETGWKNRLIHPRTGKSRHPLRRNHPVLLPIQNPVPQQAGTSAVFSASFCQRILIQEI